ncbi:MAG: hypothetical protein JWN84_494 [Nocardioides sp.]|nr:hypothetical protein [Nocardioides sp.]
MRQIASHPEDVAAYSSVVDRFRQLTGMTWPNGRCCNEVRDGVPKCCYLVVDGEDLLYTAREVAILVTAGLMPVEGFVALPRYAGRVLTLDRSWWTPTLLQESLWRGAIAETVESAAHPTRPVLIGGQVVGVSVVEDCNTRVALQHYRSHLVTLRELWQGVVDLTGTKPYYGTRPSSHLVLV